MVVAKVASAHVPVEVLRLDVQGEHIGKQFPQCRGNCLHGMRGEVGWRFEAGRQVEEAEKEARGQEMRGVFSGLVKVAIDISPPAGAVVAGMPWLAAALSPIASFSVRSGLQAIVDGTKRWF